MTQKNQATQRIRQLAIRLCGINIDEQLTELFERDNNVSFKTQTSDEIALLMLNKIRYKTNE